MTPLDESADQVFRQSFEQRRLSSVPVGMTKIAQPSADKTEALILAKRIPLARGHGDVRQLFAGK